MMKTHLYLFLLTSVLAQVLLLVPQVSANHASAAGGLHSIRCWWDNLSSLSLPSDVSPMPPKPGNNKDSLLARGKEAEMPTHTHSAWHTHFPYISRSHAYSHTLAIPAIRWVGMATFNPWSRPATRYRSAQHYHQVAIKMDVESVALGGVRSRRWFWSSARAFQKVQTKLEWNQKFSGAAQCKTVFGKINGLQFRVIHSFLCNVCNKLVSCGHQGERDVSHHYESTQHQKSAAAVMNTRKLNFKPSISVQLKKKR